MATPLTPDDYVHVLAAEAQKPNAPGPAAPRRPRP